MRVGTPTSARRAASISLVGASMFVLLDASPVWGAGVLSASKSGGSTSGAGLLLAMSAGVVVLGIGGFTALTLSRRKRVPQQCALEREALIVAEQAVRYWEGALAHLEHGVRTADGAGSEDGSRESQASLLAKAKSGHAKALQVRDERQLDLIRCMASGAAKIPPSPVALSKLEPIRVEGPPPNPPATPAD